MSYNPCSHNPQHKATICVSSEVLEKFQILHRVTITMHVLTHALFVCLVQLVYFLNQQAKIVDSVIFQGMLNVREKVSDLIIT